MTARMTERLRRARPRVQLPAEIKMLVRQVALRSLALQRSPGGSHRGAGAARLHSGGATVLRLGATAPWFHSRTFWIVTAAGLVTAFATALVAAFLW
jgi:hypothetical protein